VIVNEQVACPDKHSLDVQSPPRKALTELRNHADRAVSPPMIPPWSFSILNYIKGYHYELFVFPRRKNDATSFGPSTMSARNGTATQQQKEEQQSSSRRRHMYIYRRALAADSAYEPPDDRNRWDKPLYRVDLRPENSVTDPAKNVQSCLYAQFEDVESALTTPASADAAVNPEMEPTATRRNRLSSEPPTGETHRPVTLQNSKQSTTNNERSRNRYSRGHE
jgi:tRNA uridine 5-carbamoylmethylation protein Kti12